MTSESLAALRTERQAVLDFCSGLTVDEWAAPSRAVGWDVKDVVAHFTAGLRALITPEAFAAMRTKQIERFNDIAVEKSRPQTPEQVLADFTKWTNRGITALGLFTAPGIGRVPLPVGELGVYPMRMFPALYTFDWHTHLRFDVAPAVDRPAPPTDHKRMTAILGWLMALLEQSHRERLSWLDAPLSLTLNGPGGTAWRIEPAASGKLRVMRGTDGHEAARINAQALEFPAWSTTRVRWRDCDVKITGDNDIGERFLDTLNLV